MARILITGIAGGLPQLVANRLVDEGHEVCGVDFRPLNSFKRGDVHVYQANYNKTRIEDIFRRHEPTHVLHLGRVGNLKEHAKRFDLNVVGSAKIFELCLKYGVERLVVLSTFHIYGAHPHNHILISEDEPLRASQLLPQLGDAVQLDNMATTWIFRHRTLRSVVLRPCNIVGPHIRNAISEYLRKPALFYLAGFNPMTQFIHENDMVAAIVHAFAGNQIGVYNVAGTGALPWLDALALTGHKLVPILGFMADLAIRFGHNLSNSVPPYLVDFMRYPCVINDARFRAAFGFKPSSGIEETILSAIHRA